MQYLLRLPLGLFRRWADMNVMEAPMVARGGDGTEQSLTSEIISPEHHPAAEYLVENCLSSLPLNKPEVTYQAAF